MHRWPPLVEKPLDHGMYQLICSDAIFCLQDLKDYFRAAGEISYTNAHNQRQGEGLVEFAERRGMEYALEKLDDTELNGRRLKLVEESKMFGGGRGNLPSSTAAAVRRSNNTEDSDVYRGGSSGGEGAYRLV